MHHALLLYGYAVLHSSCKASLLCGYSMQCTVEACRLIYFVNTGILS